MDTAGLQSPSAEDGRPEVRLRSDNPHQFPRDGYLFMEIGTKPTSVTTPGLNPAGIWELTI